MIHDDPSRCATPCRSDGLQCTMRATREFAKNWPETTQSGERLRSSFAQLCARRLRKAFDELRLRHSRSPNGHSASLIVRSEGRLTPRTTLLLGVHAKGTLR